MPKHHPKELLSFWALPVLSLVVLLYIAFRRLFLSPIANIPGPKLAALTGLVEFYYDVVEGGQYLFKIENWHERYGPIIRITPWQVHIRDADFYDQLHAVKQPRHDKLAYLNHRFNAPRALTDLSSAGEQDKRRAILGPLFSRQRVLDFTDYLNSRADKLVKNLLKDGEAGNIIRLDDAWAAYATDSVLWYTLAMSYDFLDYSDFKNPFTAAVNKFVHSLHVFTHFPTLLRLFNAVPQTWLERLSPDVGEIFRFHEEVRTQIWRVAQGDNERYKHVAHRTVFHELALALGVGKDAMKTMEDDGISTTLAGIETTKTTASLISFYVLDSSEIYNKLHAELEEAIPDSRIMPPLPSLERLPYLSAVIQEGLRLSYGVSGRLPRVSKTLPVTFGSYTLPPGTEVAMTPAIQHRNPGTFSDPHAFKPERWLDGNNKALAKYLVQFGKGPRMCLGMHFAQAELYIGITTVFRRISTMKLYETGKESVEMGADYLVPVAKEGKKGVRVTFF